MLILNKLLLGILLLGVLYGQAIAAIPSVLPGQVMPSLAPILEQVTPAVVNIATKSTVQRNKRPLLKDPLFQRFFQYPTQPRQRSSQSLGSGVIVDAEGGLIITNHHVIDKADQVTVTLRDGRSYSATVVGSDPESDVAVIKINADNLIDLKIADSDQLRVGDFALAIGNPFGLGQTVTSGIISALGRSGLGIEGYEDFIQTDASINPGNSGGALINLRGELIGINTAIIAPGGGNVGIGFAIPSNMAISLKDQLIKFGRVNRGQLGISVQDLSHELAQAFNLNLQRGVIISQVAADSPAAKAPLFAGDIILQVNGKAVKSSSNLRNKIGLLSVGDTASLQILRQGKQHLVNITIAAVQLSSIDGAQAHHQLSGATLANLSPNDRHRQLQGGIKVIDIHLHSPAWNNGLRKGDIIARANRAPVHSTADLIKRAKGRKSLLLNVLRDNNAFFLIIR